MTITVEVELEGLIGDELVDKHPLTSRDAVADEGHEVAVVDPADDLHLRLELPLSLSTPRFEGLHRDLLPVGQYPLVDQPEPPLTQKVDLREPTCRRGQLLVSEGALVESQRYVRRWRRQNGPVWARVGGAHVAAVHHPSRRRRRWWAPWADSRPWRRWDLDHVVPRPAAAIIVVVDFRRSGALPRGVNVVSHGVVWRPLLLLLVAAAEEGGGHEDEEEHRSDDDPGDQRGVYSGAGLGRRRRTLLG